MTDRELDARIAAQHSVIDTVDTANTDISVCALPRPDDVRRLLALQDAVGDLSAALSHGHTDLQHGVGAGRCDRSERVGGRAG
jgi:hypothetical protein